MTSMASPDSPTGFVAFSDDSFSSTGESPVGRNSFRKGNSPFPSISPDRGPSGALQISWGARGSTGSSCCTDGTCRFKRTSASAEVSVKSHGVLAALASSTGGAIFVSETPSTADVLPEPPEVPVQARASASYRCASVADNGGRHRKPSRDVLTDEELEEERKNHECRLLSASLNATGLAAQKMLHEYSELSQTKARRIRKSKDSVNESNSDPDLASVVLAQASSATANTLRSNVPMGAFAVVKKSPTLRPSSGRASPQKLSNLWSVAEVGGAVEAGLQRSPWECFGHSFLGLLGCSVE